MSLFTGLAGEHRRAEVYAQQARAGGYTRRKLGTMSESVEAPEARPRRTKARRGGVSRCARPRQGPGRGQHGGEGRKRQDHQAAKRR